jgi:hypothetical protein
MKAHFGVKHLSDPIDSLRVLLVEAMKFKGSYPDPDKIPGVQ